MQIGELDRELQSATDLIIANQVAELEMQGNTKLHCTKTGKPCGLLPAAQLSEIIRIHGIDRLHVILPKLQMTISTEWIFTDPEGLQSLALYQPREYLIYAISNLLPEKQSPSIQEQQKEFENKKTAWVNLQEYETILITTAAELCRRLLAKNRPACLHDMLLPLSVNSITSTLESISEFIALMQACLAKIKSGYYEKSAIDERNRAMEQYRLQKQLKFLTDLEIAIGQEFNDFELFGEHSAEFIEASSKHQTKLALLQNKEQATAKRAKLKRDGNMFTSKTVINPSFTGLRFGGEK